MKHEKVVPGKRGNGLLDRARRAASPLAAAMAMLAVLAASSVSGGTSTWTGLGSDGKWLTPGNWDGDVPGTGDTAVFSSVQAGARTTIDLDGMEGVGNLTVTGADAPVFTFGTSSSQILRMAGHGSKFLVEGSVANMPILACSLGLGNSVTNKMRSYIENNSSKTLHLGDFGYMTLAPGLTSTTIYLYLTGSGNIQLDGLEKETAPNYVYVELHHQMNGELICNSQLHTNGRITFLMAEAGGTRRIRVNEGARLYLAGARTNALTVNDNLHVYGDGCIQFLGGHTYHNYWHGIVNVASGKELKIEAELRAVTNSASDGDAAFLSNGKGVIKVLGPCTCAGTVVNIGSGVIEVRDFGLKGNAWTLGSNDCFRVGNGGLYRYVGAGDNTTDRDIVLVKGITSPITAVGGISHAGGGTFTVDSVVSQACEGTEFVLENITNQLGVFRHALTDNPYSMALRKTGAGRWDLYGNNTYTGATTVEGGTLGLMGGSLASPVSLNGGAVLEVAADAFGSSLSVTAASGASTLNVTGSGELVLSSLTSGGGSLNVSFDKTSTSVRLDGQPAVAAPAWLTVNGEPAEFNAAGRIVKRTIAVDTEIAARGGVVPDGSAANVGITTAGTSGPITLAGNSSAAVNALVQKTDVPATVSLAGPLSLAAKIVSIAEDAADLSIGSQPGEGTLVAGSGADVLELNNESANGNLEINATLSSAVPIRSTGAGTVRLTAPLSFTGELQLNGGILAVSNTDATISASLTGSGTFRKEGDSGWTFSTAQNGFYGDFVLAGGYNAFTGSGVFGAGTGAIVVTNGATLDLSSALVGKAGRVSFGDRELRISGTGVNGNGALRFGVPNGTDSEDNSMYAVNRMALDGDALIGMTNCYSRFSIGSLNRSTPALFDMNGHALTKKGGGNLSFANGAITNAGLITIAKDPSLGVTPNASYFRLDQGFDLGGTADGPALTLENGTIFVAPAFSPQKRPLVLNGPSCTIQVSASGNWSTNFACWAGPVTISEGTTLSLSFLNSTKLDEMFTFAGPIGGSGELTISGRGRTLFLNGANTFSGALTVNNSTGNSLYAAAPGSIPDPSKLTVWYGRVAVAVPAWTDGDIANLLDKANLSGAVIALDTSTAEGQTYSYAPGETFASKGGFGKDGEGTLVVTGPISSPPRYAAFNGTLKFTGGETFNLGDGFVTSDENHSFPVVAFDGAEDVVLADGKFLYVGGDGREISANRGIARFSNTLFRQAVLPDTGTMAGGIIVGYRGRGVMTVGDGACVTSRLQVAVTGSSSQGAVYQSGGEVVNWSTPTTAVNIGNTGSGYYEISNGTYRQIGAVFGVGGSGWGVFRQKGGTVEHLVRNSDYVWIVGRSRFGVLDVSGGDMRCETSMYVCEASDVLSGAHGVYTVEGTAEVVLEKNLIAASQPNSVGIVNLDGGSLSVQEIYSAPKSGSLFFLNFDGGVLRVTAQSGLKRSIIRETTRTTVFAGGAKIDTGTGDYFLSVPLEAPEGNGVVSVSSDFIDDVEFIGSPVVEISGTGHGASAYADFDSQSGRVTGIRVTSPGFGYAASGTKAIVYYGNVAYTSETAVAVGPVAGGGLEKKGSGTLTLMATNTYQGATVVSSGTLKLGCDMAIPSNTTVRIASGASLDMNGKTLVGVSLDTASGGTVAGDFTMPAVWTIDMAEVVDGNVPTFAGQLAFPSGMEVRFENMPANLKSGAPYTLAYVPGGVTGGMPDVSALGRQWRINVNGGKLRLAYVRGFAIDFR